MDAQDSTSRFSVGFFFGNDWCSRFSKATDDLENMKTEFDSLEVGKYGYTGGFLARYSINPRWNFQAGIAFANRGYRIDTLSEANLTNMKFNFRYIEMPLQILYVFDSRTAIQPVVSFGCYGGYLIHQKTNYHQIGVAGVDHYNEIDQYASFNFGISASVGFKKIFLKKNSLQCDVIYKQALLSVSESPLKRYLNSVGFQISYIRSL